MVKVGDFVKLVDSSGGVENIFRCIDIAGDYAILHHAQKAEFKNDCDWWDCGSHKEGYIAFKKDAITNIIPKNEYKRF